MADEATLVLKTHIPMDFIVTNGTGIEKGTLLKMTDPRTAIISSAEGDQVAGIARREKILNDGRIRLSVFRGGVFRMKLSGSVGIGQAVAPADTGTYPNFIRAAPAALSGGQTLGISLEEGTNGNTIEVELNIGVSSSIS